MMFKSAHKKSIVKYSFNNNNNNNNNNNANDQNNSIMSKPIDEQNEWIRDQLAKLWTEDEADYFVNPNRVVKDAVAATSTGAHATKDELLKSQQTAANKTAAAANNNNKQKHKNNNNNGNNNNNNGAYFNYNSMTSGKGLYAQSIWEALRNESGDRLKPYDLDRELQDTMNKFLRNGIRDKNETAISLSENNPKMMELKDVAEMKRIKQARKYRSEIELMFRSSKLNEERVSVLRTNSPLPDLNDFEGRTSIVRYLPPIDLTTVSRKERPDSALEFANSTSQRLKLKQQLRRAAIMNTANTNDDDGENMMAMMEYKPPANTLCKVGDHTVQLKFLVEKPYAAYKSDRDQRLLEAAAAAAINNTDSTMIMNRLTDDENDGNRDDYEEQYDDDYQIINQSGGGGGGQHNKTKSLVLYNPIDREIVAKHDPNITQFPPLSLNALMEYKPLLVAPGAGDFNQGKNRIFKQIET